MFPVRNTIILIIMMCWLTGASAAHICWVERVTSSPYGVNVFMMDGYDVARRVAVTHTDGSRSSITPNSDGSFTIRDGESVVLRGGIHDSCTAKAVTKGGKLGLDIAAKNCSPGIGCTEGRDFLVPP